MKLRTFLLPSCFLAVTLSCLSQTPSPTPQVNDPQSSATWYARPDAETRRKRYLRGMFGPFALTKYVVSAGVGTATNSPEEWGGQWKGFGKRVASGAGQSVISHSVTYGLDEAFKLDSHFYRSRNRSTNSRILNALISPVTARKANGKRIFGFSRVLGAYTGGIVAAEAGSVKSFV